MRRYMAAVEVKEDNDVSIKNVELSAKNHNSARGVALHVAQLLWPSAKSLVIDSIARLKKGGTPVSPVTTGDDGMLYVAPPEMTVAPDKQLAIVHKPLTKEQKASKPKAKPKSKSKGYYNAPSMRDVLTDSVLKEIAEKVSYKKYDKHNEGYAYNLWAEGTEIA